LQEILTLDAQRREIESEISSLNALKNQLSPQIGQLIRENKDASEIKEKVQSANLRLKEIEEKHAMIQDALHSSISILPNICHHEAPIGSESANKIVREWGKKREFAFPIKDHKVLALELGIWEEERAVKVSGSGFIALTGQAARLERALINFFLDTHSSKNGFKEIVPPILVHSQSMFGTSQLPKFKEQSYYIAEDDLWVIPTAEVSITNLFRDEMLKESDLPMAFVGYTPCFRREAGSHGTGVKGFLRTHQFNKVEMVKFSLPENSEKELDHLVQCASGILEALEIPYRVLDLATGDMGFGASRCFDIEVWSPGENRYLEASSCSNFLDFQSRRMNLRFKRAASKPEFVHTLNGSGLATSRLFVSLIENNQNPDGSISIPKVLQKYTGFDVIKK
jgi:seryl-tRNA synthetase